MNKIEGYTREGRIDNPKQYKRIMKGLYYTLGPVISYGFGNMITSNQEMFSNDKLSTALAYVSLFAAGEIVGYLKSESLGEQLFSISGNALTMLAGMAAPNNPDLVTSSVIYAAALTDSSFSRFFSKVAIAAATMFGYGAFLLGSEIHNNVKK